VEGRLQSHLDTDQVQVRGLTVAATMTRTRAWNRWIWLALPLLLAMTFWPATTMREIFYFGDIYRHYYPVRAAYAQALAQGTLPLWTPTLVGGYPVLAEGQVGALYPPNLILCSFLPVEIALNLSILAHFLLAGLGMYLFCRSLCLQRGPSLIGGVAFMLGGFMVPHLNHVSIVSVAAWLPYLLLVTRHAIRARPHTREERSSQALWARYVIWTTALALLVAVQFLAGHPQISLLNMLLLAAYTIFESVRRSRAPTSSAQQGRSRLPQAVRLAWPVALAVLLGAALAAVQLIPTYELTTLSQRAGGLEGDYFTSFSLHPFYLATLVVPFVQGNPYPSTSVESIAYIGILPLALAMCAPVLRHRNRQAGPHSTGFWGTTVLIALLLAFGRWNPLYPYLARVPILNLFRVPARFLHLFAFACSVLAAIGLQGLADFTKKADHSGIAGAAVTGALLATIGGLMILVRQASSVEDLIQMWHYLPALFILFTFVLVRLAWRHRLQRSLLLLAALLLTATDLFAFNAVYGRTYNDTMPRDEFLRAPKVLDYLPTEESPYRIYTHEEILPVLSVMRESMYPNLSILHGVQSANGYLPLFPSRYSTYLEDLTPRRLNLLNVRYFVIPQLLPVDESTEFYDLEDPFAPTLVGRTVDIPPTRVVSVTVESYLGHSAYRPQGEVVADLWLVDTVGDATILPLRAGCETSEWAYDRSDVIENVQHARAPVARSWPARSGFPPEPHEGHVYAASFTLEGGQTRATKAGDETACLQIAQISVRPRVPVAYLRVERVLLQTDGGQVLLLSQLTGEGHHTLAYRSEDAAIYRVHDALPRAWLVHTARVVADDHETLRMLDRSDFDPREEVLLSQGANLQEGSAAEGDCVTMREYSDQRVVIETSSESAAYLVLADAFYPGWEALIRTDQGQPDAEPEKATILRANYLFRAVALPPGDHTVEFRYRPRSLQWGALISAVTLLLMLGTLLWATHRSRPLPSRDA